MKRETLLLFFVLLCAVGDSACGGGASQPPPNQSNPVPVVTAISPTTAAVGGAALTLTVNGANFLAASTVNIGESALVTTFVSPAQLTAALPAADIASLGTLQVDVSNPAPGGGNSNAMAFTIASNIGPGPAVDFLAPNCVPAGEQFLYPVSNQLVVGGANFEANSVVRWNGSARPTTFSAQSGQLTVQLSASDIATAGNVPVTVFNPPPNGGTSSPVTFTVSAGGPAPQSIAMDSAGKFAYVADTGCGYTGYVSMYTINTTTGALTSIGPPAPVPDDEEFTDAVTVDPSGKFVYVASSGDVWDIDFGNISTYTINPTTGALTSTGTGGPGGDFPNSLAVDPSGKFAFAADGGTLPAGGAGGSSNVSMYTIDGTTGALTLMGTVSTGTGPDSVAVDPSGKFVYVTNEYDVPGGTGSVSMYTLDATTGALTSIGTIAAGTEPVSVVADPAGQFAYVANFQSNNVSMYSIDATTGALTSIGTIAAGTNPDSVAVDPAGKFAYVSNNGSNNVSMYTINSTTGALTSVGMIAAGQFPTSVAVHPSGKFVYVTNYGSNTVSMYSIDATTGVLTLIGTVGS
jgi:6-phosphogluconolactonase (cycloisomerase 2 family)